MKTILWMAVAMGLGIFVSTYQIHGQTPLQMGQRMWKQSPAPGTLNTLGEQVGDAMENAKDKLRHDPKPHEHHSDADRDALNKLIAKRGNK